jgi:hypothetical protein
MHNTQWSMMKTLLNRSSSEVRIDVLMHADVLQAVAICVVKYSSSFYLGLVVVFLFRLLIW